MNAIREPAVAGQFYPRAASELGAAVDAYLADAVKGDARAPKAIIAPHAGFIYSAPIAATAYARLEPVKNVIKRVVLLGPCHRIAVQGLALSSAQFFLHTAWQNSDRCGTKNPCLGVSAGGGF